MNIRQNHAQILIRRCSICALAFAALIFSGCSSHRRYSQSEIMSGTGQRVKRQAFPAGKKGSDVLLLTSVLSKESSSNHMLDYQLEVKNLTNSVVNGVVVYDGMQAPLRLEWSDPSGSFADGVAIWRLGKLEPYEARMINAKLSSPQAGTFHLYATVEYEPVMHRTITIIAPEIELEFDMPSSAMICDDIPASCRIRNKGTGPLQDVEVKGKLPTGLVLVDGKKEIAFSVPVLLEGQARTFAYRLRAVQAGAGQVTLVASSKNAAARETTATVLVSSPKLGLTSTGPDRTFSGRNLAYDMTVTNTGTVPVTDVTLINPLPRDTAFVSAGQLGKVEGDQVIWRLGTLPTGESVNVGLVLRSTRPGVVLNTARAVGPCGTAATATSTTIVEGVPALRLEVVDTEDPVEVGSVVTYEIIVENQGTADATGIKVICAFEDSQKFISCTGTTRGTAKYDQVDIQKLDKLKPGEKATWYVRLNAEKAGDVRFTVQMNCDQLDRPVQETEATKQY